MDPHELLWPAHRLYEAVHRLCAHAGLLPAGHGAATPAIDPRELEASLVTATEPLGLELQRASIPGRRLGAALGALGPAVVRIDRGSKTFVLAVAGRRRGRIAVVGPSGEPRELDPGALAALVDAGEPHPAPAHLQLQPPAGVPAAYARLLQLSRGRVEGSGGATTVWQLRPSPAMPLLRQLVTVGLHRTAAGLFVLSLLRTAVLVLAWWILGRGALAGVLEPAMLLAWALCLATFVAVNAAVEHTQGHFLLAINARWRHKLLHGATKVPPRSSAVLGSGQLLGRMFETEALDTLAVNAGIGGITAVLDVALVTALLLAIPGARLLALVLVVWILLVAARSVPLYRLQKAWAEARIAMSETVVENLLGRRTRAVQTDPAHHHREEDRDLARYVELSARVDTAETRFEAVVGRGFLVAAMLALALLAAGPSLSTGSIVAAVGAVLLASQALARVAANIDLVAAVVIAWRHARLLYRSSEAAELHGLPQVVEAERAARSHAGSGRPLLRATGLSLRTAPDRAPIVDGASFGIDVGDRILLTGPSGGGKSTLASLLAGLEAPASGALLLRGLDLETLGQRQWAQRVAYVPPFGRNHVFADSFLYNLSPDQWPPTPARIDEAERVCEELGLRPLLDRMPGRLQQLVGETGWRLSHGERVRLFLARALLQRPELVILDESFGALDPVTMQTALDCVRRRCPTLVVISHV